MYVVFLLWCCWCYHLLCWQCPYPARCLLSGSALAGGDGRLSRISQQQGTVLQTITDLSNQPPHPIGLSAGHTALVGPALDKDLCECGPGRSVSLFLLVKDSTVLATEGATGYAIYLPPLYGLVTSQ